MCRILPTSVHQNTKGGVTQPHQVSIHRLEKDIPTSFNFSTPKYRKGGRGTTSPALSFIDSARQYTHTYHTSDGFLQGRHSTGDLRDGILRRLRAPLEKDISDSFQVPFQHTEILKGGWRHDLEGSFVQQFGGTTHILTCDAFFKGTIQMKFAGILRRKKRTAWLHYMVLLDGGKPHFQGVVGLEIACTVRNNHGSISSIICELLDYGL